jgi:hypothetical protein
MEQNFSVILASETDNQAYFTNRVPTQVILSDCKVVVKKVVYPSEQLCNIYPPHSKLLYNEKKPFIFQFEHDAIWVEDEEERLGKTNPAIITEIAQLKASDMLWNVGTYKLDEIKKFFEGSTLKFVETLVGGLSGEINIHPPTAFVQFDVNSKIFKAIFGTTGEVSEGIARMLKENINIDLGTNVKAKEIKETNIDLVIARKYALLQPETFKILHETFEIKPKKYTLDTLATILEGSGVEIKKNPKKEPYLYFDSNKYASFTMHSTLAKMLGFDNRLVFYDKVKYPILKTELLTPTYPLFMLSNIVTATWCKNVKRPALAVLVGEFEEPFYLEKPLARISFDEIDIEIVDCNNERVYFENNASNVTTVQLEFVFLAKNV